MLSELEMQELSRISYRIARWVAYCEDCRSQTKENRKQNLPAVEIDYSKDLPNSDYFRWSELQQRFFGETKPYSRNYEHRLKE